MIFALTIPEDEIIRQSQHSNNTPILLILGNPYAQIRFVKELNHMNNLRDTKVCNLCGSHKYKELHYYPPNYYNHTNFETYSWDGNMDMDLKIVKCSNCKLVYQNPCFNSNGLKFLYPTEIIPDILDYENLLHNHKFHYLLGIIDKFYPHPNTNNYTMLDFGTRYGVLPELLFNKGFKAFGLELNKKCVSAALKSGFKNIHQGTIDNLGEISNELKINRINLAVLVDVIEHLLNPMEELKKIAKFQDTGDRMIITTMNINSLGYKLFKSYWYYIHAQHTYYFSEKTLARLFNKLGYEVECVFQVDKIKNLTIFHKELVKWLKHKIERIKYRNDKNLKKKLWFATNRPSLFDIFTIVVRKKH